MLETLLIALAFILVLLNGFFVAAEFSMVKLRHTRVQTLEKTAGLRGKILAKVHQKLDTYLSACQLGITLSSLGLGWIGEPAMAHLLEPLLQFLGVNSRELIELISFAAAFSIISFLHIVVGELMPKSLAIRQAERISLWTALPLYAFYWTMYPAIYVLNASANLMLKLFGLDSTHHDDNAYSTDEFKLIVKASHSHGEFTKAEADMIEQTLEFSDLQVSDVMRPYEELVALNSDAPIADNMKLMVDHHFSRYPIYQKIEGYKEILGIVHTKDLFTALQRQETIHNLKECMRPAIAVSPECTTLELLGKFRHGVVHMALVYHHEVCIGFVTLDNLLQVIVGRIKDEFNPTQKDWVKLKNGNFKLKAYASIYILEQLLDIDLSSYPVTTVSGLILNTLERFPSKGEKIAFEQFDLEVEAVAPPKIISVLIKPKAKTESA